MTDMETKDAAAETVVGVAAGAVGLGTLMLALFPFAIPILALTAVFVAPLALLGLIPLGWRGDRRRDRARGQGRVAPASWPDDPSPRHIPHRHLV